MGANPEDTQREIDALRSDASAALDELQSRLSGGVQGVMGTDTRVSADRTRQDVATRAQAAAESAFEAVEENPSILGVAGVVTVAAVGYGVYAAVNRWRESRKPQNRLRRRAHDVQEDVKERFEKQFENARKLAEEARRRGLLVRIDRDGNGKDRQFVRVTGARLDLPETEKGKRSDVLKKLLWAATLALFMATGGVLARRAAGGLWRATLREDPPTEK